MVVPIKLVGPRCPRRGCGRPAFKDGLCARCWRLATMFGRDPRLFAHQPLHAYRDDRDAVAIDWDGFDRDRDQAA